MPVYLHSSYRVTASLVIRGSEKRGREWTEKLGEKER